MTKTSTEPEIKQRKVGERVRLTATLEATSTKDLGDGILEAIITTSAIDRHNETIVTEGIDTDAYMKNPVVMYGHDYYSLPIGKTLSLKRTKNKIKARFQLAVDEYPFAKRVYDMVKNGYLNTTSIGGLVKEWSDDYRSILQLQMLEFSIVPIPANEDAIITGRSFEEAAGATIKEVRKEFEDFAQRTMLDKIAGMPDDEVSNAIKVLENLLATLKESNKAHSFAGKSEPKEVRTIKRIRLAEAAKAVNRESERLIRVIKLKRESKP